MSSRSARAVLWLASALLTVPMLSPPAARADDAETTELPLGKKAWDMRVLDEDPVKVVKVSYDPKTKEASWVLEFRRDLNVRDTDWRGFNRYPPFWFRFEDADGVALMSVSPTYASPLVGLEGRRARLLLKLPDAAVMDKTKKVRVDPRPYGE